MLQAISNSALSLLMVATLLWGGCISCSQFFMLQKSRKSCCQKNGQCKRPSRSAPVKECKRMPLEPQAATSHVAPAMAALPEDPIVLSPALEASLVGIHPEAPGEPSPPDLPGPSLHVPHLTLSFKPLTRFEPQESAFARVKAEERIEMKTLLFPVLFFLLEISFSQPLRASGHGPVFGLATPTNPKGGWSLDFNLMGRAGDGFRLMFRPAPGLWGN